MTQVNLSALIDSIAGTALGVSTALVGHSTVQSALVGRQRATGLQSDAYTSLLSESIDEQNRFCQLLLISESWFERESETIVAALSHLRSRQSSVSVLSAPCARGEEPISAIYLALRCGFALSAITAVGIDLSETAIEQGKRGEFTSYSFRGTSHELESCCFDRVGRVWHLKRSIQQRLTLHQGNILDPYPETPRFDLVLCRNLLIYLERSAQVRLIETLLARMNSGGLLVFSAAEAAIATSLGLAPQQQSPLLFTAPASTATVPPKVERKVTQPTRPRREAQRPLRKVVLRGIDTPWELASRGYLEEAFAAALQQLEQDPHDAECYFLLGLISSSGGSDNEASEWFRQTLRLDPTHEEAQLMLAQRKGQEDRHENK